jgi:hypothetical protein
MSACLLAGLVALASACRGAYAPLRIEAGPNLTQGELDAITYFYVAENMTDIFDASGRFPKTPISLPMTVAYAVFNSTGSYRVAVTAYGDATPDPIAVAIAEFDLIDGKVVTPTTDGYVVMVLDPLVR